MKKKGKAQKKSRLIRLSGFLAWWCFILGAGVAAVSAFYMVQLDRGMEKRFKGRLWDIPSRIYSDITLVYPGQTVNRSLLMEKLDRLGYQNVSSTPAKPGQMKVSKTGIDIFLHAFTSPFHNQESALVRIGLTEKAVTDIRDVHSDQPIGLLELEPELLMLYFGPDRERRRLISIGQVPRYVIQAFLAAEDRRFYEHHGFEVTGILRAFAANLKNLKISQGGSTITQQLAKNYFLTPERTLIRKYKELLISLLLEFRFDKDTILEMYLNEIYFGQEGSVSINGIGEAARFYFDKSTRDLSVSEAAVLAGVIKAPNQFSPYKNPERCKARRDDVLAAMHRNGWLADKVLEIETKKPVRTAGYREYHLQAPYFMDYLTRQLVALYSRESLSSQGLSIFTTLDTQVQSAAEKALKRGLERLEKEKPGLKREAPDKKLQGAVIVMQPKTGNILAMVGGRDYGQSQFNRATQAMRQPGSAFKPFVYLAALDTHTPLSSLSNSPKTYKIDGQSWTPKNYYAQSDPVVTFRKALAYSQNIATVNLALDIGLERVAEFARTFHFSTTESLYPSLALGTLEVTPLSLARAYCVFAADGVLPYAFSIREVVDTQGLTMERRHAEIERLTTPAKAYIMSDILLDAVREGTARSLASLGVNWPVAGKTGTTNDARDAWFVGFTPNLLAMVWVGFDNNDPVGATGAQAALPIWADLMKSLPQYVSGEWLAVPPDVEQLTICLDSGYTARPGYCRRTAEELFLSSNRPEGLCPVHKPESTLEKVIDEIKKIIPSF